MSDQPVIIITGASSGIGEATARLFAQEGYQVVIAARRLDRLQTLEQEIQQGGGVSFSVQADVSSLEDIEHLVKYTLERFGRIDILFNNAGFGRLGWLESLEPLEDIDSQIRVNALGVIHTSRAVLPHMIERCSGHIINMVSIAGLVATPTYTIYAASKGAVRSFTDALRREVGIHGIRVSGIYPGSVKTEFSEKARVDRKPNIITPEALRLSSDEVARAVLRLAKRPRRMLIIPWPMILSVWMNALLPGLVDWLIERRFVRPERNLSS